MDNFGEVASSPLVFLAFLYQSDCGNSELRRELDYLGQGLNFTRDINSNGPWLDNTPEDGDLETDGHLPSNIRLSLGDIQPQVDLNWPLNHEQAEAVREVAAGLRDIADQLEDSVVAQATENLARKLFTSPIQVSQTRAQKFLRFGVGLDQLPQERIIVALTLTLVKGVCKQAPRLLRHLFNIALQYIGPTVASRL
uniref:BH3-interacting domain death agonist n=1 Tax=Myripristis murdjan TaxID=586833 RepID=A0A667ZK07_9TELE